MRVFAFGLVLSCAGTADRLAAEPRGTDVAHARASFQERRERLRHQMAVELEAMGRICTLNPEQMQRLDVAARGVVERLLEDKEKRPDPNKPVEWRIEEEGLGAAKSELLEHPLWRSTIREVLTRAQLTALERERDAGKRFRREAAIRFASGLLQTEIRLTEAQRVQMAALLEKTMPDTFCEPELDAGAYTHWLEVDEVQKVLTKSQFAFWLDLQRSQERAAEHLLLR